MSIAPFSDMFVSLYEQLYYHDHCGVVLFMYFLHMTTIYLRNKFHFFLRFIEV